MRTATATLLLALTLGSAATRAATDVSTVMVTGGRIRGVVDGDVLSFKGIPFAQPPVGNLRWRAPQPVMPWQGVREANQPGHDCMQLPFPSDAAPLGTEPAEDCLVMNVWRPANPQTRKAPVLVWIYGGGFVNGGSSPAVYDGSEFARQGVVFVSFNYRLGRFGFFAHPALSAEKHGREPLGNYAYLDQLLALHWVRHNVARFGGDASQVTIVGESAGGGSVHMLLAAPAAKGLFQRAVVQSGGGRGSLMGERDIKADRPRLPSGERIGLNFAASVGIQGKDAAALAKLRALPADQVVAGLNIATMGRMDKAAPTYSGPMRDGRIVSSKPDKLYVTGKFNRADLLVGSTSGDIGGDTVMGEPARYVSRLFAQQGLNSYLYRFSYIADSVAAETKNGAPHASDIPFFFNTVAAKYGANLSPKDAATGKLAATYLANFVKKGEPNGAGLPTWPRQTASGALLLELSKDGTAVGGVDPRKAEVDAAEAAAVADAAQHH